MIADNILHQMADRLKHDQPHKHFMPDPLQPTKNFLDLTSRDVRRHFYILNDITGKSFFLRPDFTLPICSHYAENAYQEKQLFFYHGTIWLWDQKENRPRKKNQMGIEHIGRADQAQSCADVIACTLDALQQACVPHISLHMGDPALFERLIESLALPSAWHIRLHNLFHRDADLEMFLNKAEATMKAKNQNKNNANSHITSVAQFQQFLKDQHITHKGQRRAEEIVARLRDQATLNNPNLPKQTMKIIRSFLALPAAHPEKARDLIADFAKIHKLPLYDEIEEISNRFQAIKDSTARQTFAEHASFSTHFQGTHLSYYTGFAFCFLVGGGAGGAGDKEKTSIAGGGHYNGLLRQLGVKGGTGIGATLYLDELASYV